MTAQRHLATTGMLTCVLVASGAAAPDHDPTKQGAWQSVAGPGTVPGVRALAVEEKAIYVLSDRGLTCIAPDGAARVIAGPAKIGDAETLWVTPKTIWLGYGGGLTGGVKCLDRKTNRIQKWDTDPHIPWVQKTLFDGSGNIYLYEATTVGLHVFDAKGKRLWRCRRLYDMPALMDRPDSIVRRRSGDVYVTDSVNHRILVFTPDGQFKGRVPENFCRPHGLVLLPDSRLAVLTDYTERTDAPLVTILDEHDVPTADWVSDQRTLSDRQPAFFQYGLGYYQKAGEKLKRPVKNASPLTCAAVVGESLIVGKAGDGSLWSIGLDAFGPRATYPARRRKSLTRKITDRKTRYTIPVGGTLDWVNTKRSQTHSGYCRTPLFRVDDSYTLANTGKVPVVNPHFSVNGQGDFYSLAHIQAAITKPDASDLEKAFGVYNFIRRELAGANRPTYNLGVQSRYSGIARLGFPKPTIGLTRKWNSFGSVACGSYSGYVARLAHGLGLPARNGGVVGHCPSFIKVDGKEHYLDAIIRPSRRSPVVGVFAPLVDDQGFAGYDEIVHDKYLLMRLCDPDTRGDLPSGLGRYFTQPHRHNMNSYDKLPLWQTTPDTSTMAFTYRPGCTVNFRTAFFGRSIIDTERLQMDSTVNGDITYEPNFTDGTYKFGVIEQKGIDVKDGVVRPTAAEGRIAFTMPSPHPVLNGTVELSYSRDSSDDVLEMDLNIDDRGWERIWRVSKVGKATEMFYLWPLDRMRDTEEADWNVPPMKYAVRFRMTPSKPGHSMAIHKVRISSLFQTFYQCLPRLRAGENVVEFVNETPGAHELTVTHRWKESSFGHEPPPPAEPVFPKNGETVKGYQFTFKWKPAVDPSGAAIDDYEWECSKRPDFLWHVGPSFSLYTRGKTEEPVPQYSLLTHGTTYYWRVRSRNDRGVWGPWGKTWTFRCKGPRVPTDVKLRREGRQWILSWKPNPKGTRPVKYEVFADNAPSFYPVVSTWLIYDKERRKAFQKQSNILLTTDKTEVVVVSDKGPSRDRSHFRVAAIDADGSRGGPTTFVSAAFPFIFTEPVTVARVGKAYRYHARTLWSMPDYDRGGRNTAQPPKGMLSFMLKKAPKWLKLDAATGLLTGKPTEPGTFDVELNVSQEPGGTDTQAFQIGVSR